MSLGIVVALPQEAQTLLSTTPIKVGVVYPIGHATQLVVAGIGAVNAARACEQLLRRGARIIMSYGFAGALTAELSAGAVLLPDSVIDESGNYSVNKTYQQRYHAVLSDARIYYPVISSGVLLQSPQIIASAAAKQNVYNRSGADAVDMESAAIARQAQAEGARFIAIRVIADPAHVSVPQELTTAITAQGELQLGVLLLSVLRRPWRLLTLLRFIYHARKGLQSLEYVGRCLQQDFS